MKTIKMLAQIKRRRSCDRGGWVSFLSAKPIFHVCHGEGLAFFVPVGAEVEPPCVEQNQTGCQHGQARGNGIEKDGDNAGCKGGNAGNGAVSRSS